MDSNSNNVKELKQKLKQLRNETRHEPHGLGSNDIAFYKKLLHIYEQLSKMTERIENIKI